MAIIVFYHVTKQKQKNKPKVIIPINSVATMNSIERKKKDAERKRKARLEESNGQKRVRLQANSDRKRLNRYDTYYHISFILSQLDECINM